MIQIFNDTLQLEIDPAHGSVWRQLRWRDSHGTWHPLLMPLQGDGFDGGNFIMAPFCNRIRDGVFNVDGQSYQVPINQADEGMAIHGHVRDFAWQVLDHGTDHVRLALTAQDGVWHYRIEHQIKLGVDRITADLTITNLAPRTMPFGIGYHPWFPRQNETQVTFPSHGAHRQDARALPLADKDAVAGLDPQQPQPLDAIRPLDHCFSGWEPREAQLSWPQSRYKMQMTASGALRHLQLYSPQGKAYFCLEPVSHLPDAINRPELGEAAQMDMLAPQGQLHGEMTLHLSQT